MIPPEEYFLSLPPEQRRQSMNEYLSALQACRDLITTFAPGKYKYGVQLGETLRHGLNLLAAKWTCPGGDLPLAGDANFQACLAEFLERGDQLCLETTLSAVKYQQQGAQIPHDILFLRSIFPLFPSLNIRRCSIVDSIGTENEKQLDRYADYAEKVLPHLEDALRIFQDALQSKSSKRIFQQLLKETLPHTAAAGCLTVDDVLAMLCYSTSTMKCITYLAGNCRRIPDAAADEIMQDYHAALQLSGAKSWALISFPPTDFGNLPDAYAAEDVFIIRKLMDDGQSRSTQQQQQQQPMDNLRFSFLKSQLAILKLQAPGGWAVGEVKSLLEESQLLATAAHAKAYGDNVVERVVNVPQLFQREICEVEGKSRGGIDMGDGRVLYPPLGAFNAVNEYFHAAAAPQTKQRAEKIKQADLFIARQAVKNGEKRL